MMNLKENIANLAFGIQLRRLTFVVVWRLDQVRRGI
uniref:Uncharacterized protein n=1 Tax=Rhizophora mucronata TaxID=61149 RepID=A0A2P2PU59_RHIMU